MSKGVLFNGSYIIKPGAYASIDAENMMSLTAADQKIIAVIGEAAGGIPNEIMWFDDPTIAKKVLKSGDLLKACEKAWAPVRKDGKTGEGTHIIGVIRANQATNSILEMGDGIAVLSIIEDIIPKAANKGTAVPDGLKAGGTYTGSQDSTIEIYIDSEGTNSCENASFRWRYAKETDWRGIGIQAYDNISDSGVVELADGVTLIFTDGTYVYGDVFTVNVQAEKKQRIALVIESKDYGYLTRKIQAKYGDGTLKGTKKLSIYNIEDNKYEIFDNIGATLFLTYTGMEKFAQAEIKTGMKGTVDKLVISLGENEASAKEFITIDLTEDRFRRMKSVADFISSFDDFECEVYDKMVNDILTTDLDEIKLDIHNKQGIFLAYKADITKRVSVQSQYISILYKDDKADTPVYFDYSNLVGGEDGMVPASWIQFFDKFAAHPITYLVPLTGDESIHAEAREHVKYMSDTMGRERFLCIGGFTGETAERAVTRAKSHNADRVQVCFPGFYDGDRYGNLKLYPPYLTAAMHAGRAAFLGNGESATYNYYNVDAMEYELQPEQINTLLKGGVACWEFVMGKGNRLVQDITTYSEDNAASLHTERSVRILADVFNKQLREKLEDLFVGKKGSRSSLTSCQNAVISFLRDKVRAEEILAYRNVRVSKQNTAIYVEYEAAPVEPNNFILISGHFYSETIFA